jgi:glycosyltransferase involved in cell wall biosynthesis
LPLNLPFFEQFHDLPYVSISHAQRQGAPAGMRFVDTVYNGIDTRAFQPARKGGYVLNLGRISPEKGTHVAIEVAKRAGWPLVIAAKVDPVDQAYFEERVKPHIDGDRVTYVGEVGGRRKADLLAGAEVLLHPVQWPEPFGLVMAEAMAAGTPVVATPLGSVPEVVEPGLTGYIASDVEGLAAAIALARGLDGAACRQRAVERFDAARMAEGYVRVYERLLEGDVTIAFAPIEAGAKGAARGSDGTSRTAD